MKNPSATNTHNSWSPPSLAFTALKFWALSTVASARPRASQQAPDSASIDLFEPVLLQAQQIMLQTQGQVYEFLCKPAPLTPQEQTACAQMRNNRRALERNLKVDRHLREGRYARFVQSTLEDARLVVKAPAKAPYMMRVQQLHQTYERLGASMTRGVGTWVIEQDALSEHGSICAGILADAMGLMGKSAAGLSLPPPLPDTIPRRRNDVVASWEAEVVHLIEGIDDRIQVVATNAKYSSESAHVVSVSLGHDVTTHLLGTAHFNPEVAAQLDARLSHSLTIKKALKRLQKTVRRAIKNEILVVAAAGNSDAEAKDLGNAAFGASILSRIPEIIMVGSSTDKQACKGTWTDYSDKSTVHVFVPGNAQIASAFNTNGAREQSEGTSMAAPYFAGIAARALASIPNLRVLELIDAVKTQHVLCGGSDPKTNRQLDVDKFFTLLRACGDADAEQASQKPTWLAEKTPDRA